MISTSHRRQYKTHHKNWFFHASCTIFIKNDRDLMVPLINCFASLSFAALLMPPFHPFSSFLPIFAGFLCLLTLADVFGFMVGTWRFVIESYNSFDKSVYRWSVTTSFWIEFSGLSSKFISSGDEIGGGDDDSEDRRKMGSGLQETMVWMIHSFPFWVPLINVQVISLNKTFLIR